MVVYNNSWYKKICNNKSGNLEDKNGGGPDVNLISKVSCWLQINATMMQEFVKETCIDWLSKTMLGVMERKQQGCVKVNQNDVLLDFHGAQV